MPKIKPTIARTPEDRADTLGLPRVAAEEWQFQHVLLARLKEITRRQNSRTWRSQGAQGPREPESLRS